MALNKAKNSDYTSLKPSHKKEKTEEKAYTPILPRQLKNEDSADNQILSAQKIEQPKNGKTEFLSLPRQNNPAVSEPENTTDSYREQEKTAKKKSKTVKNQKLISADKWIFRRGHGFTFAGIYLFTFFVFFRPYELIPGLGFLSSGALFIALATIIIYVPTQLSIEGSLTVLSTEVKCILAMTLISLLTIPIAKDPLLAWNTFSDVYIKAVLMFIIMINVLRTRKQLISLMWVSFAISIFVSWIALSLYLKGEFKTEGYRVSVEIKGLFENPNEMALHLTMMIPLVLTLAIASKNKLAKLVYFIMTVVFLAATIVTFSRGGFLGLIISSVFLAWKLGRDQRVKTFATGIVVGLLFIILSPGNYGLRSLSIFVPGLDPVGSSDQRSELLKTSILVTLRNPLGIGIGNFPVVGVRDLQSHNAFTQVSSEIGWLGLIAYLIFIISPFRKLGAIERTLLAENKRDWFYYLSIGIQASIITYLVGSFFASVAYNWYIYYVIAYAVAFRRIYLDEDESKKLK